MYGIIYKATGPSGLVYIGKTTNTLAKRKSEHAYCMKKGDKRSAFQFALLVESFSSFTWEQIDTAETKEELDEKEKQWIAHYESMNPEKGYNQQYGDFGRKQSAVTKRKLSEINKGKIHSAETRKKLSEALKGRKKAPFTEEHRRKLSEAKKGCVPWNKGKRIKQVNREGGPAGAANP